MGTRSHQHQLVGGDGQHAALDVDPVEGRGGGSGTRSGERRTGTMSTGLQHGHAHAADSSLGTSGKADSFGSPGDHEDAKTRRTLERHQSRLQPERLATAVTPGSHTVPTVLFVLVRAGGTAASH